MIIDQIRNRSKYYFLGDDYKKALDFFAAVGTETFEKADILLPDSAVLIRLRPMITKDINDCSFEAHRKYADIHFVAYGKEKIGYNDVDKLKFLRYDEVKDTLLLKGDGDVLTLLRGYFMITFKDDAHMPCICVDKPEPLGKMIAKIKL